MALLIAIIAGSLIPFQTAINARLREYVISPFLSSLISFAIGTIFLTIVILVSGGHIGLTAAQISQTPWWAYLGGLLGMIGLTTNILLFPILGSVQTVIMPILGQVLMSMLIDNFGWFDTTAHPLSIWRLLGVVLLIIGVLTVVALPAYLTRNQIEKQTTTNKKNRIFWQLIAIIVGGLLAIQSAINGHLGGLLHAPLQAAWISFLVGTILLFIVNLCQRSFKHLPNLTHQKLPWWIWLGGLLGALYISSNAFFVPIIGTGTVVVLALFGQIIGSLNIDQFGLLGAIKNRITPLKLFGLALMLIGVVLIELL